MPSTVPPDPLVSIVTPCLNPGRRLEGCIASVRGQTYPNIQHIIIDGGSTDGTRDLLSRLTDVQWVSEPDTGQANAINKGFRLAKGDVIAWLNADDEYLPHAIEKSVECFRDPQVAWSFGNCEMVYDDKEHTWVSPLRLEADSFDWKMPIPQQSWFMARWAWEEVGPLDESLDLAMDFDMCIRLQAAGLPSCRVPHTLARFIIHSESKTGQRNYSEFIREGARALLKAGREVPSYAALGQSCAHASVSGDRVPNEAVEARLLALFGELGDLSPSFSAAVRAGAYASAAQIESKSSATPLRALRWIARPAPWRFGLTRRLIPNVIETSLVRYLEASRARSLVARLRKLRRDRRDDRGGELF
jgi:GT2 family glycosyltransferase